MNADSAISVSRMPSAVAAAAAREWVAMYSSEMMMKLKFPSDIDSKCTPTSMNRSR